MPPITDEGSLLKEGSDRTEEGLLHEASLAVGNAPVENLAPGFWPWVPIEPTVHQTLARERDLWDLSTDGIVLLTDSLDAILVRINQSPSSSSTSTCELSLHLFPGVSDSAGLAEVGGEGKEELEEKPAANHFPTEPEAFSFQSWLQYSMKTQFMKLDNHRISSSQFNVRFQQ